MLRAVLGEPYLDRVTVIVKPKGGTLQPETNAITGPIMKPGSPFHSFYRDISQPKIVVSQFTRQLIGGTMRSYSSFVPYQFCAQQKLLLGDWQIDDITSFLQQALEEHTSDHPDTLKQPAVLPKDQDISREGAFDRMHAQTGSKDLDVAKRLDSEQEFPSLRAVKPVVSKQEKEGIWNTGT